ncbi:uncharacterized protein N7487_011930 [Penicillium crustosum]|uniref:uncharacterized protein n=1 Tax=Penicillium crustosum TaxID=36656 RepID=UPI002394DD91|nr:uncharacterized protein N7487_011930 [Penicillium crustosum]KAJ5394289.1 hypothetical protein N7487_011930 [Penicillium crustosum]
MESSDYKRRKKVGFAYPPIPVRDQDILSDGTINEQSSIRILHVSSSKDSSPADAFRAESITHTNKENEQFVRDHHPSLSSQASVFVAESVSGEPVWLIGSPLTASQSVYAGGRPIHYFPGDHFLDIPSGILTPRSPDKYNEHFDRYINPRRFLTPADLDSLRELFPEAVGVHVLIAGFLIILFADKRHVHDAYSEVWPLELAGLRVFFHLTDYSFTTAPVESGTVLKETSEQRINDSAGCLGLKLRLQNGSTAVTSVTHGFVRLPGPGRFGNRLRVFDTLVDKAKRKLQQFLPFKAGEDDRALVMTKETPTDNNPVGKQVSLASSNRMIGTITHTYDTPSNVKQYPAGYNHDLCLISGPSLPDVVSPPGYPLVTGWANYSAALDGQNVYVVAQNTNTGGLRKSHGVIDSRHPSLGQVTPGTKSKIHATRFCYGIQMVSSPQRMELRAPPLCLGRPSDTTALAVVFQNFQQSCLLADITKYTNTTWRTRFETKYTLIKAGFILPLEVRDSTILSGEVPNSTIPFNTLPARNPGSIEYGNQRRVFSSIESVV